MAIRYLRFATIVSALAMQPAPLLAADLVIGSFLSICSKSFAGKVVTTDPADRDFASQPLVMQVRMCSPNEVRIPFHVGNDASRTWMITSTPTGWRLKHRHMHKDGTPDISTNYGGDHAGMAINLTGGGWRLEFPADAESKQLFDAQKIPVSKANIWAIEHVPGRLFAYELRRPNRHLRVEFDLSIPVKAPQAPWGFPAEKP